MLVALLFGALSSLVHGVCTILYLFLRMLVIYKMMHAKKCTISCEARLGVSTSCPFSTGRHLGRALSSTCGAGSCPMQELQGNLKPRRCMFMYPIPGT